MDGLLKEIAKLEKLTSNSSAVNKSKSPAINDSLDSLLQTLLEQKARIERGASCPEAQFQDLSKTIEQRKKEIDDRQKEVYNSLARYGKALDKVRNLSGLLICVAIERYLTRLTLVVIVEIPKPSTNL